MKVDLHVHSKHSTRPSQWILQRLGCPESFTEPVQLYRIAKQRGMSLVTVTDHNSISGALELAHLADVFVSEEITAYFPDDRCKIHVLAYDISERQHADIQKVRENVIDLVAYLQQQGIVHAVAHPLFAINDRLTSDHFERLLLLFKTFEINGARVESQNQLLQWSLAHLTRGDIEDLADRHGIEPAFPEPWEKHLIGGSDDHSSLNIARRYTEVPGARDRFSFLAGVAAHRAKVRGKEATPLTFAHNLYGIAYQFYKHKLDLDRSIGKDLLLRFLDRILHGTPPRGEGVRERLYTMLGSRRRSRLISTGEGSPQDLLRAVSHQLIAGDPRLMAVVRNDSGLPEHLEGDWFQFVDTVSNKVLMQFGTHLLDQVSGANLFNVFGTIGSSGALYALLAPFFVSFAMFRKDQALTERILGRFARRSRFSDHKGSNLRVAHFTDTLYEVNGVALTLLQQLRTALDTGKSIQLVTCDPEGTRQQPGVTNFTPIGFYELPVYRPQRLFFPPLLEMLVYCYEERFTLIHSATPGPIGLAALAIARILKLPICGTYHTALPQYAKYLTDDPTIEEWVWRYTLWYYEQMDFILVPSRSTGQQLLDRGIDANRLRLMPRGVDTRRFHPAKRSQWLNRRHGLADCLKLLYVGRISREKNLQMLGEVFKTLVGLRKDVALVVVGDGPYREEMQKELASAPCVFTGYLEGEALAEVYASCDLFVFPSTTDTFGNVILEAQAAGLPVIVTDAGGPQENIIAGRTGLIVPAEDRQAFLIAIQALLANPRRLNKMRSEARAYAEGRSFDQAFERTWEIYEGRGSDDARWTSLAQAV